MRAVIAVMMMLVSSAAFAQPKPNYSIKDKKAIAFYEEGLRAYNLYEYSSAVDQLNRAIDRSSDFIEARLLLSQVYGDQNRVDKAIEQLESAVAINPNFFPTAFYFLGEMYMTTGDYQDAEKNFSTYLGSSPTDKEASKRARLGLESCEFAIEAVANPVPFNPENLGPKINSPDPEYYPCLTGDENTLLFTREVSNSQAMHGRHEDFFIASRDGDSWGDPRNVREINSLMNEGAPSLSPDGQTLIFTACEIEGAWGPDRTGLGSCDLFFSYKQGTRWSVPMNLGEKVNSYYWESQPSIAPDGRTLYFVRGRFTGRGITEQDIWVSKLAEDGVWQKPTRLEGEVNTPFAEESVFIHPDGRTLYFSSNGHAGLGGLDIFFSQLQADGTWGTPVNLGYPINTHNDENSLLVSASGEVAYFASDREGGYGALDLYKFDLPENLRPNPVSYARGTVFSSVSFKKLGARFQLMDLETQDIVVESYSNEQTGEFLVTLPAGRDYGLNVYRSGYLFYSDQFTLAESTSLDPFELEIPLQPIKEGSKIILSNIFFDTNKADLKKESMAELEKMIEFLALNPDVRVEISGHTDSVGSEDDNLDLSQRRADAVVEYLVNYGIDSDRLVAKGYGEKAPIADNETEEGRQKNRRTEFEIL